MFQTEEENKCVTGLHNTKVSTDMEKNKEEEFIKDWDSMNTMDSF